MALAGKPSCVGFQDHVSTISSCCEGLAMDLPANGLLARQPLEPVANCSLCAGRVINANASFTLQGRTLTCPEAKAFCAGEDCPAMVGRTTCADFQAFMASASGCCSQGAHAFSWLRREISKRAIVLCIIVFFGKDASWASFSRNPIETHFTVLLSFSNSKLCRALMP